MAEFHALTHQSLTLLDTKVPVSFQLSRDRFNGRCPLCCCFEPQCADRWWVVASPSCNPVKDCIIPAEAHSVYQFLGGRQESFPGRSLPGGGWPCIPGSLRVLLLLPPRVHRQASFWRFEQAELEPEAVMLD